MIILFTIVPHITILSNGAPGWARWEVSCCRSLSLFPFPFSACVYSMIFKVAIFGHSYVRDLQTLGEVNITDCHIKFNLRYFPFPGATFNTFIDNPDCFELLKTFSPHFIIVVLGGNDLKDSVELSDIYRNCKHFYTLLRDNFPKATIIASQIENRFYLSNNRFGSPAARTFDYLRRHFNRHLNNQPYKDHILQVQGPNRLDKSENYRDFVHLSQLGLRKYFRIIVCTLTFAIRKDPYKYLQYVS